MLGSPHMWRVDQGQHIHVDASIPERDVLARATNVAQSASPEAVIRVDLAPMEAVDCTCGQPADWKTYRVLLYTFHTVETNS